MAGEEASMKICTDDEGSVGATSNAFVPPTNNPSQGTVSKQKPQKDLEKEEFLRHLQTLSCGDSLFFKKSVLGDREDGFGELSSAEFVEGRVICWTFDESRQYVVVSIRPYGTLQFVYGDLYRMALAHDVCLHQPDRHSKGNLFGDNTRGSKSSQFSGEINGHTLKKHKSAILSRHMMKRMDVLHRGTMIQSGEQCGESLDEFKSRKSYYQNLSESMKAKLMATDGKTRPIPPGVETFCKCRFVNKIEFVRKIRGLIKANRQKFMEATLCMQELRLILTQNVRAYELEMVAYILNANPWCYSSNPQDEPSPERVKEIIELYKTAVRTPLYCELFAKWQAHVKNSS